MSEPQKSPLKKGFKAVEQWVDSSPLLSDESAVRGRAPDEDAADSRASSGIGADASRSSSVDTCSPPMSSVDDVPDVPCRAADVPCRAADVPCRAADVPCREPGPPALRLAEAAPGNGDGRRDGSPPAEGVKFIGIDDRDSICSSESESDAEGKPVIPDGGWGWVVVASSLLLSIVADGISFSFGVILIEFLDHFQASTSLTSLIGSLFIAVPLIFGPVMSALVDRYGCRTMTIIGGLVSATGFILASMANSIVMMLLTFGVIAGLGLGFCFVTAVVSVTFWFDKKRTLAVGLGACGTGIGTFIYAPMTRYFIDEYGWRGAILLLAGTFLNLCVCGCVMRDPEWLIAEQRKQAAAAKAKRTASNVSISGRSTGGESTFPGVDELKALMKSGEGPEYILTALVTSIAVAEDLEKATEINRLPQNKGSSVISLPTFLRQSEKVPVEVLESLSANKRLYKLILENYPSLLAFRSTSEQQLPTEHVESPTKPVTMSLKLKPSKKKKKPTELMSPDSLKENTLCVPERKPMLVTKPILVTRPQPAMTRQHAVAQHYLRNIKMHRNSVMHRSAMMNLSKYKLRASSCPNIYRNSSFTLDEEEDRWYTGVVETLKSTFEFSMFLEFHFLLMCISDLLLFVWFIVPYFYLGDFMVRYGHSEDNGASLLVFTGIANTIGMVLLGWMGDQPWMNVSKAFAVCMMVCGLSIGVFPLIIHSYWMLATCSVVFGLSLASTFSFTPSLLVEFMPLDKFTSAYGLILMCEGIGHLIGPPISGLIFDLTGNWDMAFYLASFFVILSGVTIGIIPYTKNFRIGSSNSERDVEDSSRDSHTS